MKDSRKTAIEELRRIVRAMLGEHDAAVCCSAPVRAARPASMATSTSRSRSLVERDGGSPVLIYTFEAIWKAS